VSIINIDKLDEWSHRSWIGRHLPRRIKNRICNKYDDRFFLGEDEDGTWWKDDGTGTFVAFATDDGDLEKHP
jgi:hypothetical protein